MKRRRESGEDRRWRLELARVRRRIRAAERLAGALLEWHRQVVARGRDAGVFKRVA